MEDVKTFKDLEFEDRTFTDRGAVMLFDNGYGVSVITGGIARTDDERPYELAVLRDQGDGNTRLCYDTPITDDVVGYLTEDGVSHLMQLVQEL